MPGKRRQARAVGPYPHGGGWRAIAISSAGDRVYQSFGSKAEAEGFIREYNSRAANKTVTEAIGEFLQDAKERGTKASTITTNRFRLEALLRPELFGVLGRITAARAKSLYAARSKVVRPDTHRGELSQAVAWGAFCVDRGYFGTNPFESVEATGSRSARKRRLRVDSARTFVGVVLEDDSPGATAVALALLTGLRASEVCNRLVRDVDDGGKLLHVVDTKTDAGERDLEIPMVLRERIGKLCKGRSSSSPIFQGLTRHALYHLVKRFCKLAGVEVVSPHDLRRSFASISRRSGATTEHVAAALGHAGIEVTRRHYLDAGSDRSAGIAAVTDVLFGNDSEGTVSSTPPSSIVVESGLQETEEGRSFN